MHRCEACCEAYTRCATSSPRRLLCAWTAVPLLLVGVGLLAGGGPPRLETDLSSGAYLRSEGVVSDRFDARRAAVEHERQRSSQAGLGSRRLQGAATLGGLDDSDDRWGLGTADDEEVVDEEEVQVAEEAVSTMTSEPDRTPEDDQRVLALPQQPLRLYAEWKVDLYYEAKNGDVFDPKVIDDIHKLELRIASLPSYKDFCLARTRTDASCREPISSMRFFFGTKYASSHMVKPDRDGEVAYYIYPDGQSESLNDRSAVLAAMAEEGSWPQLEGQFGRLWYFDPAFPYSRRMRTRLWFGAPLPGYAHRFDRREEQLARFERFVTEELYPVLTGAETDSFKVYFEGNALTEHEVARAVLKDSLLAIASLALVWAFMAAYTRGPLLAAFGMGTVVLSLPVGLVAYMATGHGTFPVINFVGLFLLAGIGADNLFVLTDAWRQAGREHCGLAPRLRATLRRAGRAIVACASTTAVSFLANLWSAVRPLRWFGAFVGLCVICNLLLCLGIFPLVLILREGKPPRPEAGISPAGSTGQPRLTANDGEDLLSAPATLNPDLTCEAPGPAPAPDAEKGPRELHGSSRLERWMGERYAPAVWKLRWALILAGCALTLGSLILVSQRLEVSGEAPRFFAAGNHNLGNVEGVRSSFGNNTKWAPVMETEPLRICAGCMWAHGSVSLNPKGCKRLGLTCNARPCAGTPGVSDTFPCAGRGLCNAGSGRCTCPAGWAGPDCRLPQGASSTDCGQGAGKEACSGNGICNRAACWCRQGWFGDDCSVRLEASRDCLWGTWSGWSACTAACGWGQTSRDRQVAAQRQEGGRACAGRSMETKECKARECDADCAWGDWGAWGSCEATCGAGLKRRQRTVRSPPRGRGLDCAGGREDVVNCTGLPCGAGCSVAQWAPVGACSASCGDSGLQLERGTAQGACPQAEVERPVPCNRVPCPTCVYGEWENDPKGCSATCGEGRILQLRRTLGGSGCAAADSLERLRVDVCNIGICPAPSADCSELKFGQWTDWTACSAECGDTQRRRMRSGPPECDAEKREQVEMCVTPRCPRTCERYAWKPAAACSATCGLGRRIERRDFEGDMPPQGCPEQREVDCASGMECPIDCRLGAWVEASPCSATCGGGSRREVRSVLQFGLYGGALCPPEGSPLRLRRAACQENPCPAALAASGPAPAPGAFDLQLRLRGLSAATAGHLAELKNLLAAYLGLSVEDIVLSYVSGHRLRRLQDGAIVISVVLPDGAAVDLTALRAAIDNGTLQEVLLDGRGFEGLSHVEVVEPSPTPVPAPAQAQPAKVSLPDNEVATVDVVFGLQEHGGSTSKGLRYDQGFDLSRMSAQAAVERLCREVSRLGPDLALRRTNCFLTNFKVYLGAQDVSGYPVWPGSNVHGHLADFVNHPQGAEWREYVGFSDDGSRALWVRAEFVTDLARRMPAADAWTWATRWDAFIARFNAEEKDSGIGKVFHTSELWVRAETETNLISTTLICALVSVLSALVMVVVFLAHLALAVYVVLTIVCVAVCLAACMFGVLGWPFGAVEAVGLIVFVGFSVDYSLHLAESFNQSKEATRYLRTRDALRRTGGALVASAATSALAALPILFCTIQVFVNFGLMIILNTILSLVFSVGFLAAVLMAVGPLTDPCGNLLGALLARCWGAGNPQQAELATVFDPVVIGIVVGTSVATGGPCAAPAGAGRPPSPSAGYAWTCFDSDGNKKDVDGPKKDGAVSSAAAAIAPGGRPEGSRSWPAAAPYADEEEEVQATSAESTRASTPTGGLRRSLSEGEGSSQGATDAASLAASTTSSTSPAPSVLGRSEADASMEAPSPALDA